jgi:predicted glycosyl hydrolase (DUF1957 family)
MRYILFAVFCFCLFSCNPSAIKKQLSGTDSLVINFNDPQTNTIKKTVATAESNAISRLSEFVDAKDAELFKCGYDGNMIFFSNGTKKMDVSFQYSNDSCRHFIFDMNGELKATKMSNEAADFLKSLAGGNTSY